MIIRPPNAVDKNFVILLEKKSRFQDALKDALTSKSPHEAAKEAVNKFIKGEDNYIDSYEKLNLGSIFLELRDQIEAQEINSIADLQDAIKNVFDDSAKNIVRSSEFEEDNHKLSDSIIAIKLEPKEHNKPIAMLTKVIRTMELVKRVADKDKSLDKEGEITRALKATLILPKELSLGLLAKPALGKPPRRPERRKKLLLRNKAEKRARNIDNAIEELMALRATDLNTDIESKIVIKSDAVDRLTYETKSVLKTARIEAKKGPYGDVIHELNLALDKEEQIITDLMPLSLERTIGFIGNTPIYSELEMDISAEEKIPLPWTVGKIKPVGEGDLLIVKQQLIRYQGGDIAHIENVLQGETRNREHRRTRRTEEFHLFEEEIKTEEERDLESTERFEVQRETEETLTRQSNLETGLNISASYGPIVQIDSNLNYSLEKSKEHSKRYASELSKEIINKSVSKLSEKIREKRTMRIIEENEEKNQHAFAAGDSHVIGVYQWVDKVYEAQIFNYGLRTIYDIMVPEPGAFLWEAMKRNLAEEIGIVKPIPFNKKPRQIRRYNYGRYIKRYQVRDVEPPPEEIIYISKTLKPPAETGDSSNSGIFTDATEIEILPDGYEAIQPAYITIQATQKDAAAKGHLGVTLGTFQGSATITGTEINNKFMSALFYAWDEGLPNLSGSIPFTVLTKNVAAYTINTVIKCKCTRRKFREWQHDTHAKIMQAYLHQKAEYEEKIITRVIQEGVEIAGRNPAANRKLEKNELKKACISLITQQHFDDFNSIEEGSNGLPQINISQAEIEGPYIRFFEHAFEWENMTYVLYPYFWGRKSELNEEGEVINNKWKERIQFQDVDPKFADFITAGAARVVIPARPGFEVLIEHFRTTGEIWEGGELPEITDEMYLPIIEEMKEQLGAPGKEVPWNEEQTWEVTVPTTLVRIRPDGSLPRWIKDEEGNWVSAETADNYS
jgi:hypothetical protein